MKKNTVLTILGTIALICMMSLSYIIGEMSCDIPQGELTVYTTVDIYYVNTAELEITTESGHLEEFTSFPAMQDWLEANTAHDVNYKLHSK